MSDAGQTKAIVFQHVLAYVEERFGKAALEELRGLPIWADLGANPESLSISTWYPNEQWIRLLIEVTNRFHSGLPERCADFGAYFLERDLRGVYRVFLMVTSTRFLLRSIPAIWRVYNASGESRVVESSERHGLLSLEGYSHPCPHEWHLVAGATGKALELAGAQNVRTRIVEGLGEGETKLVLRVEWD
ncbi:MAG: TIGR02265 family protein [Myxococcota bacterium]